MRRCAHRQKTFECCAPTDLLCPSVLHARESALHVRSVLRLFCRRGHQRECVVAGDTRELLGGCVAAGNMLRALPVSVKETGKLKSVFSWLLSNRRGEVRPLEMRLPRPQPDVGRCHGSHFLPPPQHESCLSLRPPAVADCPENPGILKL